ncbi:hypothetical protein L6164_027816 [Bauhinia variegata]|uniref:Uncharacterized protein n=1 Tax=Bauhinia variegata TaxID=167791 RepID=A0ACB9LUL4_BAUVA|nr:hypothetical protein L6164_027816 [Bauhinia variegata]
MSKFSFPKFQYGFSGRFSRPKNPPQAQIKNSFKASKTSSGWSLDSKEEELKWVFGKFDTNRDGKISLQEYKAALRAMNRGAAETEAAKSFQVIDSDGDGFIDFKEFIEMYEGGGRVKETELQSAFQVFDLNGDGKITAEELSQVLKKLGEGCSLSACRKMVKGVDANGDGVIDLNEFIRMMTSGHKLI